MAAAAIAMRIARGDLAAAIHLERGDTSSLLFSLSEMRNQLAATVGEGSSLAGKAGSTIGEVVDAVRRVTAIMNEISAASKQQSSGIGEVNLAIRQMDDVTQRNAALVEQAAAAAGSLDEQTGRLRQAVAAFTVESHA